MRFAPIKTRATNPCMCIIQCDCRCLAFCKWLLGMRLLQEIQNRTVKRCDCHLNCYKRRLNRYNHSVNYFNCCANCYNLSMNHYNSSMNSYNQSVTGHNCRMNHYNQYNVNNCYNCSVNCYKCSENSSNYKQYKQSQLWYELSQWQCKSSQLQ